MFAFSLVLALSSFSDRPESSYHRACEKALADNIPMVVYVGCKVHPIEGTWCCHTDHLEGYDSPCVIVSVPQNGRMVWAKTYAKGDPIYLPMPIGNPGDDALDEVNATRAARGLRPFIRDEGLTQGARATANYRAANLIQGHVGGNMSDFAFVPSGTSCTATGCAAWEPSMGWGSCCTYDGYTYAGAAWAMGRDGRRFMSLFVR